jgi:hypothetical protein
VVQYALKSLHKRKKPTAISGWINRLMVLISRCLSRKQLATIMGGIRQ